MYYLVHDDGILYFRNSIVFQIIPRIYNFSENLSEEIELAYV